MVIAISAKEVLLNYSEAYFRAWAKINGVAFENKNASVGDLLVRCSQEPLSIADKRKLLAALDNDFWRNIREIAGASDACNFLSANGMSIHVLFDTNVRHKSAISDNLMSKGFIFSDLHFLPRSNRGNSSRETLLKKLNASAFVDGHLSNFRGVSDAVHKALITGRGHGNQNSGFELATIDSMHPAISYFSDWWMTHRIKNV